MTNYSETDIEHQAELIADLQMRLAFQEDTLQVMSGQMALQAQELHIAQQQIQLLNQKLNELFNQLDQRGAAPADEPPPHY
jgi:SlyX protein